MTIRARFEIPYFQYLNAQNEIIAPLPEFTNDASIMQKLYRYMVLTRQFDNKAIALQRTGKMGTFPASSGQEAVGAAVGDALRAEDVFVPYYRDYAAQFQRGVTPADIYRYWGGDEWGSCYQSQKEDFPISVPIASQCLHAAGIAAAFKFRQEHRVALTTMGDGATSKGDFYEAINVAGAWHLPMVFIVNNNQWAISVPLDKQTACETIAQKAIAAGFVGEQVDGNDVIALRERVGLAIEKARDGGGPTLIEAINYRLCDHTTADDATRYRQQSEVEQAQAHEPIARLRQWLMAAHGWNEEAEVQLLNECKQVIDSAVEDYLNTPKRPIDDIFNFHFAELPAHLAEQKQQALEERGDD